MIRILLLVIGLIGFKELQGQDISVETLRWSSGGFRDLVTGEDFTKSCEFITNGKDRVKWIQNQGSDVLEWTVSLAQGSWVDVKTSGSYQYQFSDGALSGEITIQKSGAGWLLDLAITGGTDDIKLKYVISTVEKL